MQLRALKLSLFSNTDPDCSEKSFNVTYESVTTRRSLWSVEGNVTCNDDYYQLLAHVTCLGNGSWTPPSPRCQKRLWRYPETLLISDQVSFPIPGTVMEGWSMCVEGVPTKSSKVQLQIDKGSFYNVTVHTSWLFDCGCVVINDKVNGSWGTPQNVWNPPFPLKAGKPFFFRLTVNTSTTVNIYMDNTLYYTHNLKFSLSSFTRMFIQFDVNLTKVESWCKV
ncbi:uncharacterized protein LOC112573662 [Pomacea canaliculata]|uniref:uncharacterized protein LOC112573662 n=1 Tax=Pomacea canaliculata TaxID=400727 RepID=UPI000D72ECDB|nr:uncharacterized protein LOC112573662 [Pomacea canaliculata]